jgi:hypothetical protein
LSWHSEPADEKDVESDAENRCNLVGDRHASAWQREHEDVGSD